MDIDVSLFNKPIDVDTLRIDKADVSVDVLRLDQIHSTISGNKWFKLKYNLLEAQQNGFDAILSFGGAYSNHLHALAYAGKLFGIKTIGIVRGEDVSNPTLNDCVRWGMELKFVSRATYRKKAEPTFLTELQQTYPNSFIVPEGGDNTLGQQGCVEILNPLDITSYDILCCSIGTGTTICGLAAVFKKEIWGFAPFKNALSLKEKLTQSVPHLHYIDTYHFGGFGKTKPELIDYMQVFQEKYGFALDRVYTAKMFFGIEDLLRTSVLLQNKKMLVVHTGGLQGNRSSNSLQL